MYRVPYGHMLYFAPISEPIGNYWPEISHEPVGYQQANEVLSVLIAKAWASCICTGIMIA